MTIRGKQRRQDLGSTREEEIQSPPPKSQIASSQGRE
jgi:hypothetical protein